MPDSIPSDQSPENLEHLNAQKVVNQSGGVDIDAEKVKIDGDIAGRDKIVQQRDSISANSVVVNNVVNKIEFRYEASESSAVLRRKTAIPHKEMAAPQPKNVSGLFFQLIKTRVGQRIGLILIGLLGLAMIVFMVKITTPSVVVYNYYNYYNNPVFLPLPPLKGSLNQDSSPNFSTNAGPSAQSVMPANSKLPTSSDSVKECVAAVCPVYPPNGFTFPYGASSPVFKWLIKENNPTWVKQYLMYDTKQMGKQIVVESQPNFQYQSSEFVNEATLSYGEYTWQVVFLDAADRLIAGPTWNFKITSAVIIQDKTPRFSQWPLPQ